MKESKGCFRLGSNPFFVKVLQIWHVYIVFEGIVADNELRGKVMERAFAMLAELLQQEQFELLISEEDQTDHSVETDIRLVYLMNDAVESFLVFKEAKMTGKYLRDYEGMLDATLSKEEETYILTVWQDDQALTIFFLSSWNWKFIFMNMARLRISGYRDMNICVFWSIRLPFCGTNMITLEKITARILKRNWLSWRIFRL